MSSAPLLLQYYTAVKKAGMNCFQMKPILIVPMMMAISRGILQDLDTSTILYYHSSKFGFYASQSHMHSTNETITTTNNNILIYDEKENE